MLKNDKMIKSTWKRVSRNFSKWAETEFGSPFIFEEEIIFHYTSSTGLKGIIESDSIWASNLSFVNDSKELMLGLSMYQIVTHELYKKSRDPIFKKIAKAFIKLLQEKSITNRYACSFTTNGDQLSQWLGYGSKGLGYAIGFESKKLVGNLKPKAETSRIIYDEKTQQKYVERHLSEFLTGFADLFGGNEKELKKSLESIIAILEQESEITILGFKHTGFKEESENRFHLSHQSLKDVYITEKNGILIPYIELKPKNTKKLPIREITIGPTADYERAKKGLDFLLKKNGYKNVEIKKSEIPYNP